ncbi:hypothetical protein VN97_g3984 [Penicillium thymicola]|uniref:Uncharacterized protein n=1 Tax=Penicillium thymicola TaxID=293382 RepID=A0AAI9TL97_PENTH|nr:hypothetical protein VN97_g3984 [Penicillium thymicola]
MTSSPTNVLMSVIGTRLATWPREAVDVEEYLEERGIYLRNTASNDTAPTDDTMYQPFVPDIEQNINMLALLGDVARGEITRDIIDNN